MNPKDKPKQRKSSGKASRHSDKPFYGTYVSVQDTKMAGPYGVLDGEDLEQTRTKNEQKNGGRGGI
ncbi:MAG: hypothetical protein GX195_09295 [Firmicutes bacterium]|nr:hypothetical protein [Bacillota bacterium]